MNIPANITNLILNTIFKDPKKTSENEEEITKYHSLNPIRQSIYTETSLKQDYAVVEEYFQLRKINPQLVLK